MDAKLETATVGAIGGRRSLADACRGSGADPGAVSRALETLPPDDAGQADGVSTWPLDRLIDHIVSTHHAYVRSSLPTIARYLSKLAEVHGSRHPELTRVAAYFEQVFVDLDQHLIKEEQVLFPYVRELVRHDVDPRFGSPFGTIENPIHMMEREHQEVGEGLRVIRELTNMYIAPADGCTTYRVCLAELERFEQDLHRHVHLENNILFPKAVELERAVFDP